MLSPIILVVLMLTGALFFGLWEGLNIGFEIWEKDIK